MGFTYGHATRCSVRAATRTHEPAIKLSWTIMVLEQAIEVDKMTKNIGFQAPPF
ncbi:MULTISPECIES: hypothetical protein [Moorena]|uniref:Uncharacterized protein n=1 Tax=Moorena producens 3L TaxID=489825 RepID=F4XI79_9CYAN|nr:MULTISPECIES: hypothetical protein [Moorena]NEQ17278.1 hypothetical protein [Moorena sp. SIO3E2]NES87519.1 hypothetical protein [Moorena sp. SIO2B7]EGJ35612.1 hypothetical protein LYNGBM3L_01640 [Moorena producens 3L]NEP33196.1 hypothetical protein [Moorena sp. SIO3B2]NEP66708.1 hypothetical protein [Moorena sp. SIO3A5]